jgi:NAD(P)-dependent dehydrogenase (short-subunit alcohol dehydrogenase family)
MTKTWFITGTSRGFGRLVAERALERGDSVAGTARDVATLKDLTETYPDRFLPLALDVTDRAADVAAVTEAQERFGRLDVVVNNAGYGHFGYIEELSEAEVRAQVETNVFGALWVTQAALPFLREQGSGHIVQISSIGGVRAFPGIGAYHLSKWALEGFSDALAQEVEDFGISVTIIEPGGYSTDWAGPSAKHSDPLPAYQAKHDASAAAPRFAKRGEPAAAARAILTAVDADKPPLRLILGTPAFDMAHAAYAERVQTWDEWADVSRGADEL